LVVEVGPLEQAGMCSDQQTTYVQALLSTEPQATSLLGWTKDSCLKPLEDLRGRSLGGDCNADDAAAAQDVLEVDDCILTARKDTTHPNAADVLLGHAPLRLGPKATEAATATAIRALSASKADALAFGGLPSARRTACEGILSGLAANLVTGLSAAGLTADEEVAVVSLDACLADALGADASLSYLINALASPEQVTNPCTAPPGGTSGGGVGILTAMETSGSNGPKEMADCVTALQHEQSGGSCDASLAAQINSLCDGMANVLVSRQSPMVGSMMETGSTVAPSIPAETATGAGGGVSLEATLLNGLADYLATQAQEETLDYLAQEVGGNLCSLNLDGYVVGTFFPSSCKLLKTLSSDGTYTILEFGSALQSALEKDVQGLLPIAIASAMQALDPTLGANGDVLVTIGRAIVDNAGTGKGSLVVLRAIAAAAPDSDTSSSSSSASAPPGTQFACTGEDQGCALTLVADAAASIDKMLDTATPCAPADDGCVKSMVDDLAKRVANDATLSTWIDKLSDTPDETALIDALVDAVPEGGAPSAADVATFLDAGIDVFVPTEAQGQLHDAVAKVLPWAPVALAIYQTAVGVHDGKNPVLLLIDTAESLPCDKTVGGDGACGLRAIGLAGEALVTATSAGSDWTTVNVADPKALEAFLVVALARFNALVDRRDNAGVKSWLNEHGFDATTVPDLTASLTAAATRFDLLDQMYVSLRALYTDLQHASKAGASKSTKQAVITDTFEVWRVGLAILAPPADAARLKDIVDELEQATVAADNHAWGPFVACVIALGQDLGVDAAVPRPVQKYVPLITALASAQTADDASAAFEKYAAPIDSYQAKRQPGTHLALTGLVGGTVGEEWGNGHGKELALFAPVGVDLTWGGCRACGAFLSVIDVGALTATRLEGKSRVQTPNPTVAQVFSPGLYFRMTLAGPLVFGAGASVVPALREDANSTKYMVFRATAFLSADVTMLPF
jgi:hypothetical protein